MQSARPNYWPTACAALSQGDPCMAGLIHRYGGGLESRGEPFVTLARSIVGQQISVKAADTIWQRVVAALGGTLPDPQGLLAAGTAGLAGAGLSRRKTEYLLDLAGHFASGRVSPLAWPAMSDEAVIGELTDIRGIGRWTAEMFLIFNLLRADVFPLADIGLQKAVALHYRDGVRPTPAELAALGETWRPWRTVATWYLWRSLDPLPVAY